MSTFEILLLIFSPELIKLISLPTSWLVERLNAGLYAQPEKLQEFLSWSTHCMWDSGRRLLGTLHPLDETTSLPHLEPIHKCKRVH